MGVAIIMGGWLLRIADSDTMHTFVFTYIYCKYTFVPRQFSTHNIEYSASGYAYI